MLVLGLLLKRTLLRLLWALLRLNLRASLRLPMWALLRLNLRTSLRLSMWAHKRLRRLKLSVWACLRKRSLKLTVRAHVRQRCLKLSMRTRLRLSNKLSLMRTRVRLTHILRTRHWLQRTRLWLTHKLLHLRILLRTSLRHLDDLTLLIGLPLLLLLNPLHLLKSSWRGLWHLNHSRILLKSWLLKPLLNSNLTLDRLSSGHPLPLLELTPQRWESIRVERVGNLHPFVVGSPYIGCPISR